MEEFEPQLKRKISMKDFIARHIYIFVLAVLLVGGISYGYTFFSQNKKIASGSITVAGLTVNFSNRSINASDLAPTPEHDEDGMHEYAKSLTITNETATNGKVKLTLTRTSGIALTDMRYALIVNNAIQTIADVPSDGVILESAIMGNEIMDVELRLWPRTGYSGSIHTFVGEITPEIKYLGQLASSISSPAGKYVNFNCTGNTCEVWQIVKVEDDRLVLTRQADYTNATSRTNSNRYNPSSFNPAITFNDDSMITSLSTDGKNVYLAKTVKLTGGNGTLADPYTITNDIFYEEDRKTTAVITYKEGTTTLGTQNLYYNTNNYISLLVAGKEWTDTTATYEYRFGDSTNFNVDTTLNAVVPLGTYGLAITVDTPLDGDFDRTNIEILIYNVGTGYSTGYFGNWAAYSGYGDIDLLHTDWTDTTLLDQFGYQIISNSITPYRTGYLNSNGDVFFTNVPNGTIYYVTARHNIQGLSFIPLLTSIDGGIKHNAMLYNYNPTTPTPTPTTPPGPPTTDTPIPGPSTTDTPIPGPSTTDTPIPGSTTTNTPIPGPSTTDTPIPGPSTTDTPIPGSTTTNTPIPGSTTTNTPIPGSTTTPTPTTSSGLPG